MSLDFTTINHQILHNANINSVECLVNGFNSHTTDDVITVSKKYNHIRDVKPIFPYRYIINSQMSRRDTIGITDRISVPGITNFKFRYMLVYVDINTSTYLITLCYTDYDYDKLVNYLSSDINVTITTIMGLRYYDELRNLIYFCGSVNLTPQQKLYLDMELLC